MRRRSRKREAALRGRPAIRSVPEPHERRARAGAEDLGLQEFVRRLPCVVCRAPTLGGDPAHRLARRRFGDWIEDMQIDPEGRIALCGSFGVAVLDPKATEILWRDGSIIRGTRAA